MMKVLAAFVDSKELRDFEQRLAELEANRKRYLEAITKQRADYARALAEWEGSAAMAAQSGELAPPKPDLPEQIDPAVQQQSYFAARDAIMDERVEWAAKHRDELRAALNERIEPRMTEVHALAQQLADIATELDGYSSAMHEVDTALHKHLIKQWDRLPNSERLERSMRGERPKAPAERVVITPEYLLGAAAQGYSTILSGPARTAEEAPPTSLTIVSML